MYCSTDARKVIGFVKNWTGADIEPSFNLEQSVLAFYPNHIDSVIKKVAKNAKQPPTSWDYFVGPIVSMLGPRQVAWRPDDPAHVSSDWDVQVYKIVCNTFLVADMNREELLLLITKVPDLAKDIARLSEAIRASKDRGVRSVYYLHGVLSRESQRLEGLAREALASRGEDRGYAPPEDFEKMDVSEQAVAKLRWADKLEEAEFARELRKHAEAEERRRGKGAS